MPAEQAIPAGPGAARLSPEVLFRQLFARNPTLSDTFCIFGALLRELLASRGTAMNKFSRAQNAQKSWRWHSCRSKRAQLAYVALFASCSPSIRHFPTLSDTFFIISCAAPRILGSASAARLLFKAKHLYPIGFVPSKHACRLHCNSCRRPASTHHTRAQIGFVPSITKPRPLPPASRLPFLAILSFEPPRRSLWLK